jgi:hypothetical protein
VQTQEQTYSLTGRAMEAPKTLCEIAELSAAATVDLHPKDRESKLNSGSSLTAGRSSVCKNLYVRSKAGWKRAAPKWSQLAIFEGLRRAAKDSLRLD